MGNYASCALAGQNGKASKAAKVMLPSGEIKHFYEPIKAAELMLDIPNHFVVNSKSLKVGSRFSAMNADENLEIPGVYVMFPMKRVNAFVTAADVGIHLQTQIPLLLSHSTANRMYLSCT